MSFESAGYRLVGTLDLPARDSALAGILIIPGSGPIDRDGASRVAPSAPPVYRLWAQALAQAGYAVLRYDKRFLTHPRIDFASFDEEAQIADAAAAAGVLRSQPGIGRVYLIGHSEGGTIATVLASRTRSIAGLVVVNTAQFPIDELLLAQVAAMAPQALGEVQQKLAEIKDGSFPKNEFLLGASGAYWAQWIAFSQRSAKTLAELQMPVLLIQCLDDQTLPGDNLGRNLEQLRAVARTSRRVQVRELRAHDHLAMRRGERQVSSEFIRTLIDWLRSSQ